MHSTFAIFVSLQVLLDFQPEDITSLLMKQGKFDIAREYARRTKQDIDSITVAQATQKLGELISIFGCETPSGLSDFWSGLRDLFVKHKCDSSIAGDFFQKLSLSSEVSLTLEDRCSLLELAVSWFCAGNENDDQIQSMKHIESAQVWVPMILFLL